MKNRVTDRQKVAKSTSSGSIPFYQIAICWLILTTEIAILTVLLGNAITYYINIEYRIGDIPLNLGDVISFVASSIIFTGITLLTTWYGIKYSRKKGKLRTDA